VCPIILVQKCFKTITCKYPQHGARASVHRTSDAGVTTQGPHSEQLISQVYSPLTNPSFATHRVSRWWKWVIRHCEKQAQNTNNLEMAAYTNRAQRGGGTIPDVWLSSPPSGLAPAAPAQQGDGNTGRLVNRRACTPPNAKKSWPYPLPPYYPHITRTFDLVDFSTKNHYPHITRALPAHYPHITRTLPAHYPHISPLPPYLFGPVSTKLPFRPVSIPSR